MVYLYIHTGTDRISLDVDLIDSTSNGSCLNLSIFVEVQVSCFEVQVSCTSWMRAV